MNCMIPRIDISGFALTRIAAALVFCFQFGGFAQAEMNDAQRSEIEKLVHDYILANPEIIESALIALEEKKQAAEKEKQTEAIAKLSDTIFNSEHQAVIGNPNGSITMVEFFDYNCGYCKRAHNDMQALLESNPDLKVVMKEFPILSEGSLEAARISVAVTKLMPESYADFHRELLLRGGSANKEKALSIASEMGLDTEALEAEAAMEDTMENFSEVRMLAQAIGISGTPSYVIGDEAVFGAVGFDQLQEKISQARQ
ncbi:MAG TPA: DsbA family protein [Afifellaceae bacterium]|nr:DsbA family protein [Afifellaceae bacterium]